MENLSEKDNVVEFVFYGDGFSDYYNLAYNNTTCERLLGIEPERFGTYRIGSSTFYGTVVATAVAKSVFFSGLDRERLGVLNVIKNGDKVRIGVLVDGELYEPTIDEIARLATRHFNYAVGAAT